MSISSTPEWKNLQAAFEKFKGLTLRNEFSKDPNRFEKYNIKFNMPGNGGLNLINLKSNASKKDIQLSIGIHQSGVTSYDHSLYSP